MIGQRALNLLGFLTMILVFVNMFLLVGNQSLQRNVAERQQFIMQSIQAQTGAREMIAAVANLAVRTDDEQLKKLLAKHGITVSLNPAPPSVAAKSK